MFEKFGHDFYINFIKDDRYTWLLDGLKNTMIITVFALLIGICIGFLVAIIRSSHDKSGNFKIANSICRVYLTVIRGTPTMVQLLIVFYVIFATIDPGKIVVAIIAFGMNSAAYVAEIVRSGIMSIDQGQTEAARSLGLSQTMNLRYIILPQALKNILPAIANEFVVIIKESAITYTIGVQDIMSAVNAVKGATFIIIEPLLVATAIYFCLCFPTSKLIAYFERRMSHGDKR